MTSKEIGIIGLGWLGLPLAQKLKEHGYKVWGTHRRPATDSTQLIFDFFNPQTLPPCDTLILNTPPLTDLSPDAFVAALKQLKFHDLIFVSSTSVFGSHQTLVNESTTPEPDTVGGKWLLSVEEKLKIYSVSVIRPGGLIGGNRHPAYFLSGKNLSDPQAKVNLIHREDLIVLMELMIDHPLPLIHAVSPYHPPRWDYYSSWCQQLSLAPPLKGDSTGLNKIVSSLYLDGIYQDWKVLNLDRL